jgi:hypothetical protein
MVNTDGPGLNLCYVKEFQGRTILVSTILKYFMFLKLLILSKENRVPKFTILGHCVVYLFH